MHFDLLIKNGRVIDPANNIDEVMDVAIADKKIAAVGKNIPAENADVAADAAGFVVTPGLIDIHAHVYPVLPTPKNSLVTIDPEAHLLLAGVTTVVDVGTAGPRDFIDFKQSVIDQCPVRVLAMINIAGDGMVYLPSEQNPNEFYPEIAAAYAKEFPDIIVGIKTAHYWTNKPWDDLHTPWASVDATLKAGEIAGVPCMFDFSPTGADRTYEDLLLKKMRPGDFHTHVYAAHIPTHDENGKVFDYMFRAREQGKLFDLGHGGGSFWFRNAVPAMEQGFYPDTISTDLHMHSIHGAALSMTHTMSKVMAMGMPLQEVIMRSTQLPAKYIRRSELGTLSLGACADIAVLEVQKGKFGFADNGNTRIDGDERLHCVMTVRQGKVLHDQNALTMPFWREAGPEYWERPNRVNGELYQGIGSK